MCDLQSKHDRHEVPMTLLHEIQDEREYRFTVLTHKLATGVSIAVECDREPLEDIENELQISGVFSQQSSTLVQSSTCRTRYHSEELVSRDCAHIPAQELNGSTRHERLLIHKACMPP
jgi:hypothetical protein